MEPYRLLGELTPAQDRIVPLVARGLDYTQIANELGARPRTIRAHVQAISNHIVGGDPRLPPSRRVLQWALQVQRSAA